MKYRDPSIRACRGPVKPLIVRTIPSLAAEDAAPVTIDANLRRVA
jgi:hypothetical protein